MAFTRVYNHSTAPKDKGLVGLVVVCPAARDDRKSGREKGAWEAEARDGEADDPVVAPHRGCAGKVRAGRLGYSKSDR